MPRPVGIVLTDPRASLPLALLHGESLVTHASHALRAAGAELHDPSVEGVLDWDSLRAARRPLVLHDCLCPGASPAFLVRAVELARTTDHVIVGSRTVTDTLKRIVGARVVSGVERAGLLELASPVVLPASVLAGLEQPPVIGASVAVLVATLAVALPADRIERCEAPASARRIADEHDLLLLEAATRPGP